MTWQEADIDQIRRRYRWIAPVYPLFNLVFGLPPGLRAKAVRRLGLRRGGTILEVGCGTGRNLPLLVGAVGPEGRVIGVDVTEPMLRRAKAMAARRGWTNITLKLEDAAELSVTEPLDGALFSLSYAVIPRAERALEKAWALVRPGGRLVIMDASVERRPGGRWVRRYATAASRASVLGNPFKRPWEDLGRLAGNVVVEETVGGMYVVCSAVKK